MALKIRRGTDAERLTITPESGELLYTTDTKKVYVGDGAQAGGNIVSGINNVVQDTTPSLGGNLDLNGNNIIGTGNINITGTITATGNINLGDGAGGDVISIGGTVSGDIVPDEDLNYSIGSTSKRFLNIHTVQANIEGTLEADRITGQLIADDSTLAWNPQTNSFVGSFGGTLVGELTGSVFADDSTTMLDGINKKATVSNIDMVEGEVLNQTLTDNLLRFTHTRLSSGTISNTTSIFREGYITEDAAGNNVRWSIDYSEDQILYYPAAEGDGGKFIQFWKSGKVGINGDPVGFAGMSTEPVAELEVYGSGYYHQDVTILQNLNVSQDATFTNVKISANNIETLDSNSNLRLAASGSGTIELDVPTQTTVGAAGAANALPATPSTYFKINVAGTDYVVPAYAVS